jgi:hypothetical protein
MKTSSRKAMFAKGFTGYDLQDRKKVHVTKDIRFEKRKARNGNDVIIVKGKTNSGHTITRIVGQQTR